ncbi:MAG: exodeoxyribonuclease VII large subunit [Elusimicrobia bacterium]|nr:exodeoxyribonuclease VII large subunit [Elusimicrobiota bacterium]
MGKNNQDLYNHLVTWRDEKAKKENIAAGKKYFIFPNSTLKNIADSNPKTINDLTKIKGVGNKKLVQYGDEIISLIKKNQEKTSEFLPEDTLFTHLSQTKPGDKHVKSNRRMSSGDVTSQASQFRDAGAADFSRWDSIEKPPDNVLTVSQLNGQIKQILNDYFRSGVWVCGEIYRYDLDVQKANTRFYRQVYFELVEQDPVTKERKATISAVMWGDDRNKIDEKMTALATGLTLKDGLQIKARCSVDFYPPQGKVQIRVTDIEPEYTIGKMALERKLILEKLKRVGLLEKNKKIEIPQVPLNVGLITSNGSAAYNDFVDELNKSGYAFSVYLCDAKMQGNDLEREVRSAIFTLNRHAVDVIAIVRGGGSASDLMGFDKEGVAVAIANSSKPVLTGIGHQIDKTIADEVSNQSFKTPTATAQFIVEKVRNYETDTEDVLNRILERQKEILIDHIENLKNITKSLKSATLIFTKNVENNIFQINEKIKWVLKNIFENNFKQLEEYERFNNSKNPLNIMKMGFGLVYNSEGKIVKSVENVVVGNNVEIRLRDGNLESKIISKQALK